LIQRRGFPAALTFIEPTHDSSGAHPDPETRDAPAHDPPDGLDAAVGVRRLVCDAFASPTMHILLIDAYKDLAGPLALLLGPHGMSLRATTTCEEADEFLRTHEVSLVLLSSMLPDRSGVQYLKLLRSFPSTRALPLIMLGTRATDIDVALTLDAGADDYVHRPASPPELERRILALLRRCDHASPGPRRLTTRQVGSLGFDEDSRRVTFEGVHLPLRRTEADLLACMMEAPGRVFTRSQLVKRICDSETVHDRVIDVHVRRLRLLLQPFGADGMVDTVRGVGYRLLETAQPLPPGAPGTPDDSPLEVGDPGQDLRGGDTARVVGSSGFQGTS
jgi:two-component system phosphate regulon response regulator PhoB